MKAVGRVIVQADGGSRGNPGPAGYGAVVFDAATGEVLAERGEPIGVHTNNVAEYSGLIAGLEAASSLGAQHVDVQMDSKLVVEQMKRTWQAKHPAMRQLRDEAEILARNFDEITFAWIPREKNKYADRLANEAMDRGASGMAAPANPGDRESQAPSGKTLPVPRPTWRPQVSKPTRLVLVRHGSTEHSMERLFSGRNELPLNTYGQAQAQALRARLRGMEGVAAVVASPLARAVQTATVIADPAPVRVLDGLAEIDFGEWEGLSYDEIVDRWPTEFAAFCDDDAQAPSGESFSQLTRRVMRTLGDIQSDYPGTTVVVVTHVTPIKALLCSAINAPRDAMFRIHLDTASVSVIDYFDDGIASLRLLNDTGHLADVSP